MTGKDFSEAIADRYAPSKFVSLDLARLMNMRRYNLFFSDWLELVYFAPFLVSQREMATLSQTRTSPQSVSNFWNIFLELGDLHSLYPLVARQSWSARTGIRNTASMQKTIIHSYAAAGGEKLSVADTNTKSTGASVVMQHHVPVASARALDTDAYTAKESRSKDRITSIGASKPLAQKTENRSADVRDQVQAGSKERTVTGEALSHSVQGHVPEAGPRRASKDELEASNPAPIELLHVHNLFPLTAKARQFRSSITSDRPLPVGRYDMPSRSAAASSGSPPTADFSLSSARASQGTFEHASRSAPAVPAPQDVSGAWQDTDAMYHAPVSGVVRPRQAARETPLERTIQGEPAAKAPPIDVNRLADEVYRVMERKLRIERERRGL